MVNETQHPMDVENRTRYLALGERGCLHQIRYVNAVKSSL